MSYISQQIQSYNLMILTFQICKLIVEIICYKCVYFGAILCLNKCSNSRKYSKVLLFSEQLYVLLYIFLQIQSYNFMILTFQICKLIVDIICYKCLYFGVISCLNKCSNLRKYSMDFTVFRYVIRIVIHISTNTTL